MSLTLVTGTRESHEALEIYRSATFPRPSNIGAAANYCSMGSCGPGLLLHQSPLDGLLGSVQDAGCSPVGINRTLNLGPDFTF